jgi:4'-phosphopantetheinyl transferase
LRPSASSASTGSDRAPSLALSETRIDLWLAPVDEIVSPALLDRYRGLLTAEERIQEQRFHFERDRKRHLVTRALVRTVLSRYWPVGPGDWRFVHNRFGCPSISPRHGDAAATSFNLSHTAGLIAVGVTRQRAIGVDAENTIARCAPLDIADRWFAPCEVDAILAARDGSERFFQLWTLKESYIKARRQGLSIPLDRFGFDLAGAGDIGVWFDAALEDTPQRWRFWQFQPSAACLVAVCAERLARAQDIVIRRAVPLDGDEPLRCPLVRRSH